MHLLLLGCTLGPLLILSLVEVDRHNGLTRNCGRVIWKWYRDFFIGLTGLLTFVEVAKVTMGEHRPHFITTCSPDVEERCIAGEYMPDYQCTNQYYSSYIITDSSRSFPSGHAGASIYVSVFCAVSIHAKKICKKKNILLVILTIFFRHIFNNA